jgi:hypothetical protein
MNSRPYDDPSNNYEWGPATALTPKLAAHGSQSSFRILKGNPVGAVIDDQGYMQPYLSAKMENYAQPVESAMLDSVSLDSYGLGQKVPLMQPATNRRYLIPDSQSIFRWPDTSVSGGYADPDFLDFQGCIK